MTKIKIPTLELTLSTSFLDNYNGENYQIVKNDLYKIVYPNGIIDDTTYDFDIIQYDILNKTVKSGRLDLFKDLLQDNDFSYTIDSEFTNNFLFICENGHMNLLTYLLQKNNKHYKKKINLNLINRGFIWACRGGQIEIIDFLLNNGQLPFNADIKTDQHQGIEGACTMGHKEVVTFLLNSPHLKVKEDEFIALRHCHACDLDDMIHYLLIEHKIIITKKIERYITRNEELSILFDKIKTKDKLQNELTIKSINIVKHKNKL